VTVDIELADSGSLGGARAAPGTAERRAFEEEFRAAMAAQLGVSVDRLRVDSVPGGRAMGYA
jgi:hypothetical protein